MGCGPTLTQYVVEDCTAELQPAVIVEETEAFACYQRIRINFTTSVVLNMPPEKIRVECERAGFLVPIEEINNLRACLLRNFALINQYSG